MFPRHTSGSSPSIDFVYFASEEFQRKSTKTINNVARFARKEGVAMSRSPEDFNDSQGRDEENDYSEEYLEREKRIADANMHYDDMHNMLDIGQRDQTHHILRPPDSRARHESPYLSLRPRL